MRVRNGQRSQPRVVRTSARTRAIFAQTRTLTQEAPQNLKANLAGGLHTYARSFDRTEALHKSSIPTNLSPATLRAAMQWHWAVGRPQVCNKDAPVLYQVELPLGDQLGLVQQMRQGGDHHIQGLSIPQAPSKLVGGHAEQTG